MRGADDHRRRPGPPGRAVWLTATLVGFLIGCGSTPAPATSAGPSPSPSGTITLYTSVTQDTVDAVVAAYKAHHPGVTVDVFGALTGQVNARIAADERAGGIKADVIWHSDPLSTEQLDARGKLQKFTPAEADSVPLKYHTNSSWGTRLLNMVIIAHNGLSPVPAKWSDLEDPAYKGAVAIPNPAAAETAFGALAFFATTPGFGIEYYRRLKTNGAVQVEAIEDVITGVAQGRYKVGMTLETSARQAIAKGSPIQVVWPVPGAISVYSPIAVFRSSKNKATAEDFAGFVLTREAQARIAATGWQPIRADVPGPPRPSGSREVAPDWTAVYGRQSKLLQQYQAIFAG
jgi:iron(III) transport system substrate-binding protein